MTEKEYYIKKKCLEMERDNLLKLHCTLSAKARQRRIDELDKEFNNH